MSDWQETVYGTIPQDWPLCTVKELIESGVLYQPLDGNHGGIHPKLNDFVEHGIPFVTAADIQNGHIDLIRCKKITKEQADGLHKGFSINGDVLLTHKATIGRTAIVPDLETEFIVLTPQVTYYRIKDTAKLNNLYLKYFFDNRYFQDLFLAWANSGSTRDYLGITEQQKLPIVIPPLPEQRAIATVLSSLDDKIDLLNRQNKTLEALSATLWRKMFVEDADPNWKRGKLGDYLEIQGGYAFKSSDFKEVGDIGIIKITNISEGLVDIVKMQFVNKIVIEMLDDKFKITTGSILVAMTGAEIGKIGIVEKTSKEIWLNQRVGMFCEKIRFGNLLGFFALNSAEGQEHILSSATGSAQPNISSTGIEDFEMPIVPDSVLDIFGNVSQPLFDKICFNLGEIRTLSTLRDSLLPKLMSGEVRVKL